MEGRPFDPGHFNTTRNLPRFKITAPSPPLRPEGPLSRPRNEHPVTFVSFPAAAQQPPWFSSPLPVPKKSHSARRFAAKSNTRAVIKISTSNNNNSAAPTPPPLVAVLSHKSASHTRAKTGKATNSNTVNYTKKLTSKPKTAKVKTETESSMVQPDSSPSLISREMTRILVPVSSFSLVKCQNQASNTVGERMQVVRTEDEKNQNPDTLRLDKCSLKQFPLIYPASEPRLRLISMQHNLITRLENVPCFNHLVVLDLYDNRIERITGLQGLNSLRVLLLGKNRLRRIEGLDSLKRLEVLDLHGNQLRFVGNLGCLGSLRVLNLAGNHFKSVRLGQFGMTSLVELNLKRNRIRNLDGLHKAPHIKKLLLANNELNTISSVYPLRKLLFLQEVLLEPNPLCSSPDYTHQIISLLPSLETLDRLPITEPMRAAAKSWHKKYLLEEEERKAAAAKARLPSSREQVIDEARQRWQSVKNFVKAAAAIQDGPGEFLGPIQPVPELLRNSLNVPELPGTSTNVLELPGTSTNVSELPGIAPELPGIATNDPDEATLVTKAILEAQLEVDTAISEDSGTEDRVKSGEKVSRIAVVRPLIRYEEDKAEETRPFETRPSPVVLVEDEDCEAHREIFQIGTTTNLPDFGPDEDDYCIEQVQNETFNKITDDIETNLSHIQTNNLNHIPQAVSPDSLKDSDKGPAELVTFPKPRRHINGKVLKRSVSSYSLTLPAQQFEQRRGLMNSRSASFDGIQQQQEQSSDSGSDDDNSSLVTVNTSESSAAGGRRNRKFVFRSRGKSKQMDRAVTAKGPRRPQTGVRDVKGNVRLLKRSDSNVSQASIPAAPNTVGMKKQGIDYLVEIDGKILNVYGQGALKFTLMGFPSTMTSGVITAKFHYIAFESMIPYFGKLRQVYPNMEHFQFRANNITMLAQLNALADLQGIKSLHIMKEGNPLVSNDMWISYAAYRLTHWGLQVINGKEVSSGQKCNSTLTSIKTFESLGYVALSCLPQTALTPLAKKLHSLHCFCCCSSSSSSDDSGRKKGAVPNGSGRLPEAPESVCRTWDDDPVLLDVIGKEALVYNAPYNELEARREVPKKIINSGVQVLEKLDLLEQAWPSVLAELVQDILMDYLLMDTYMKKEHKKLQDVALMSTRK